jgi:hypothetical protein
LEAFMTDYRMGRDLGQLRTAIDNAYDRYLGELGQAGAHWERKPSGGGEGEDGWCARQVAEHLAGASGYFAMMVSKQIGMEPPPTQRYTFHDAAAASAGMPVAHEKLMGIVRHVRQEDLDRAFEFPPLGDVTIGNVVGIISHHLEDHAQQLRSLREA